MVRHLILAGALIAAVGFASSAAFACACCGTYRVTGVAPDDVLNMRSGPGVSYAKVGAIPSGSGCVLKSRKCRRRWCKVSYAGQSGWVYTRYLQYFRR